MTVRNHFNLVSALAITQILAVASSGVAQQHSFNVASGSDCVIQEYRKQVLTPGIYDALWMSWSVSCNEGKPIPGGWYGGAIHYPDSTRVFYSFWPSGASYPPGQVQRFVSAGTSGSKREWHVSIGEGTVGGFAATWPRFETNKWYRFAVRYWQPADGTAHIGYQGHWMRDPISGHWHHQGTVQYPFAAIGIDGVTGFQEDFGAGGAEHRAEFRNAYFYKSGQWHAAKEFNSSAFSGHLEVIDGGTAVSSHSWGKDNTSLPANLRGTKGMTVTIPNQPITPTFDPIVVSRSGARFVGRQLLVEWELPPASSPQLSYKIEVYGNPRYAGSSPSMTFSDNDPAARQKLLEVANVATPYVRLTISDIFHNSSKPILITPSEAKLRPASKVAGTVSGLAYRYYEAGNGVNWSALPAVDSLSPTLQGSVAAIDATPRKRRSNYAFRFNGFLDIPKDGLYAFTVRSGNGSRLSIGGVPIIDMDGLHNSTEVGSGAAVLQAGLHPVQVEYFQGPEADLHDGIGLYCEGPGLAKTEIPASVFRRVHESNEPTVTMSSPASSASVSNASPEFTAAVSANGAKIDSVSFFLADFYSYFYRPNQAVDYFLGRDATTPYALNSMVWTAPVNAVRARVFYNGKHTIDSLPVRFASAQSALAPWDWSPLEVHNYPSGASIRGDTLTLLGDGMNLLSRKVTGDCTLVARLATITPKAAGPDGVLPDGAWRAGIVLRSTVNATMGNPLGDGTGSRFAAVFGTVEGGVYFQDDTMRAGNGDANRWSANLGGGNRWFKLHRVGDTFTSSVSSDGKNWNIANTNTLPKFGATFNAGAFIHAVQSQNPNIHSASFDSVSLIGPGVVGPPGVTISPQVNSVIPGEPATFSAFVQGRSPGNYQWQFNGMNIPNATKPTLTIAGVTAAHAGKFTVQANGVTSAPAILRINLPAGSGVWTNGAGGSWQNVSNWKDGAVANGVDAVADFRSVSANVDPIVSVDGAPTVGAMVFDDPRPANKRGWALNSVAGEPLTLAVNTNAPTISVKTAAKIDAVVAGQQGFEKTGAGHLILGGASTYSGMVNVRAGTLEVRNKSGDTPYAVAQGATLKIGYSTGGGYATTGLTINGDGVSANTGFYLEGGKTYNSSGQIVLQTAPTTIRQYGSGLANIGIFDIQGTGILCTVGASGSVLDPNIQMVSSGFGMTVQVDAGTSSAAADLSIHGPLNVGNEGFYKRGTGSLLLKGVATGGNTALKTEGGTVICGVANCIGVNAKLSVSSGATVTLNGFNQTIAALNTAEGSTLSFGGANVLTASDVALGGALQMSISKSTTLSCSKLVVKNPITFAGTLAVTSLGSKALVAGDSFQLFNAPARTGAFASLNLPLLPKGLTWNVQRLTSDGSIAVELAGRGGR